MVERIKSYVVLQNFATGEESKIYLLQAEGTESHDFKYYRDQPLNGLMARRVCDFVKHVRHQLALPVHDSITLWNDNVGLLTEQLDSVLRLTTLCAAVSKFKSLYLLIVGSLFIMCGVWARQ